MVVFYSNIIDRINAGGMYNYTQKQLNTLATWRANDKRTKEEIDAERFI